MMDAMEFGRLAKAYDRATGFMSFAHMARRTEEYAALIAAGPVIVPFVIARFRKGNYSAHWFIVLAELTKANPMVAGPLLGTNGEPIPGWIGLKVEDTAKAWVAWFDAQAIASP